MKYVPTIFVTVDILLFRKKNQQQEVLLIQRLKEPFKDTWALPGGFVDKNEDLETAAIRELVEETSIEVEKLEQLKAYGTPGRDPRGHTVSIAFFGTVSPEVTAKAQDDAKSVKWFSIDELPDLAFDHAQIIEDMLNKNPFC